MHDLVSCIMLSLIVLFNWLYSFYWRCMSQGLEYWVHNNGVMSLIPRPDCVLCCLASHFISCCFSSLHNRNEFAMSLVLSFPLDNISGEVRLVCIGSNWSYINDPAQTCVSNDNFLGAISRSSMTENFGFFFSIVLISASFDSVQHGKCNNWRRECCNNIWLKLIFS